MGGKLGVFRDHGNIVGPLSLSASDYSILKKLWSEIETNPQKYGRGIYMRFFAQFPQYVKYFADDKSTSYEDSHRVNSKFVLILSTLSYLIVDFYKKPKKFDSMLDYVAMIHHDMYLNVEDFNNFSYTVILYLKEVVPELMTDDCAKIFTEFMEDLTHQLVAKMVKARALISSLTEKRSNIYYPCRWFTQRDKVIYGHDQSYWLARRNRWEAKIRRWKTGEASTGPNIFRNLLTASNTDNEERGQTIPSPLQANEPHAQGSVMSEILHDKIWSDNKDLPYKSGPLRSRSSQNLKDIVRQSTAVAIVLAGVEDQSFFPSQLSPRERFRKRRSAIEDSQNYASTSNDQEVHHFVEMDEKVGTRVAARQRRRRSSLENAKDKTDHL